jgi:hypothetical protein
LISRRIFVILLWLAFAVRLITIALPSKGPL